MLNGRVNAIVQIGDTVVVGGSFAQVSEPGGATIDRTNLFAFDAPTGAVSDTFTPHPNGKVFALATDGVNVFIGGELGKVSGSSARVAKLDLSGQVISGFCAAVNRLGGRRPRLFERLAPPRRRLQRGGRQARSTLAAVDTSPGQLRASKGMFLRNA